MNAFQTSTYAMFLRILKVLDNNRPLWATNTKFTANYTTLSENITAIAGEQRKQESDKTGITQNKDTLRENLMEQVFAIASGLRSYAADISDKELEQRVKTSENNLARIAETRLTNISESIHTLGTEHLDTLSEYGITAPMLAALRTTIDEFKNVQPDTRLAINTGALATVQMQKLFTSTSNLLRRQLDTKMVLYKKNNRAFHDAYFQARNIIDQSAPAKQARPSKKGETINPQ
jgi:hypothetical protein